MNHQASKYFLIAALASGLPAQAQTASQPGEPAAQPATVTAAVACAGSRSYDELTADERKPPPPQTIQFGKSPVELTIRATEFDQKPVDAKRASSFDFCEWSTLWIGTNISTTGEVATFANGKGSFRGGGGGKLDPEDFARLQPLIENLPADGHRVPPAARRITVEVVRNGAATVRLYDSANLPDEIVELIRLTGARIQIKSPVFKPERTVPAAETAGLSLPQAKRGYDALTVSPDGSIGVLHDFVTKTLTVYQGSAWPQNGGLPAGGKIVRVIPESWQPDVYGGYWVNTEFTPDGRFLLVTWGSRIGAMLFSTATWQPVTDPRIFPQNLKEYLHTGDWNFGVAVTAAGETLVWDAQSHRVVSRLPGLGELEDPPVITDKNGQRVYTEKSGEIHYAAFSPDRARVAIYSGPDNVNKLRLSIFDVQSGKKERDLWPVAWTSYPNGRPVWWNNGRWIVAPHSSQFSGSGTGLWDAGTGRFLGALDLSGCDARLSPIADGPRMTQLCFAGKDQQDKALEWSVDEVRKQLESAEAIAAGGQDR
jgi:hypothetical protein